MKSALILAAGALSQAAVMHMTVPHVNQFADDTEGYGSITGSIDPAGLPTQIPSDYKVILFISGDNGGTWWDKMHTLYLVWWPSNDAGDQQQNGIPINADWSWNMTNWVTPDQPNDGVSTLLRAYVIPFAYDTKWPDYQVEGANIPGTLIQSSYAGIQVDRGQYIVTYYDAGGAVAADQTVTAPDGVAPSLFSPTPSFGAAASSTVSASASHGALRSSGVDSIATVGVVALTAMVAGLLASA